MNRLEKAVHQFDAKMLELLPLPLISLLVSACSAPGANSEIKISGESLTLQAPTPLLDVARAINLADPKVDPVQCGVSLMPTKELFSESVKLAAGIHILPPECLSHSPHWPELILGYLAIGILPGLLKGSLEAMHANTPWSDIQKLSQKYSKRTGMPDWEVRNILIHNNNSNVLLAFGGTLIKEMLLWPISALQLVAFLLSGFPLALNLWNYTSRKADYELNMANHLGVNPAEVPNTLRLVREAVAELGPDATPQDIRNITGDITPQTENLIKKLAQKEQKSHQAHTTQANRISDLQTTAQETHAQETLTRIQSNTKDWPWIPPKSYVDSIAEAASRYNDSDD